MGGILFAHPSDEAYGADRVLLAAVKAALDGGWRARVLLPDDTAPGWLSRQLGVLGVPVARGPLAPARRRYMRLQTLPRYLYGIPGAWRFVRREARRFAADVVYVNTSALLVAALVGRPGGARLIWHIHEVVVQPPLAGWIFRIAPLASADTIIAISETVRSHAMVFGLGERKVVRIYNGIDAARFHSPRRDAANPTVAFIGRLNRWKGYDLFLDAITEVAPEFPTARVRFVGGAPPGEEWRVEALTSEVERRGLGSSTVVAGFEEDIPSALSAIDIVVVPSLWPEPFGLTILEAMAARCAVVASGHGAAVELLDHGRSGLLFDPGNARALAESLRLLLGDDALRKHLSNQARERADSFSEAAFARGIRLVLARASSASLDRSADGLDGV